MSSGRFPAGTVWVLTILTLAALFAPQIALLSGHRPDTIDLSARLQPPGKGHLLGTDELGRDLLARLLAASRVTLTIALVSALAAFVIGSLAGVAAGYLGGATDWLVSRAMEVVLCFPFYFLVLALVALFGSSPFAIVAALVAGGWAADARVVRSEAMRVREAQFVEAAVATGARRGRVLFRHVMPHSIWTAASMIPFAIASAVIAESALSFLGVGVMPPAASWGNILASAVGNIERAWWLAVFPGAMTFLTVLLCALAGDRLRDSLDPLLGGR